MAIRATRGQLIIPNENLDFHPKKPIVDGRTNMSKTTAKKGGAALGNRKALNDITNKSFLHHEASSKKNTLPKKEFNVADEMFLHDHKKCIEAQQVEWNTFRLDLVLPGQVFLQNFRAGMLVSFAFYQDDLKSPCCYPEPEELPMSEFSDCFFESSTRWNSPPCSPLNLDSPPSSPLARHFEEFEFVLKDYNDG
ncbi:hypothetical protein UlMin_027606 [Ulmus minor]